MRAWLVVAGLAAVVAGEWAAGYPSLLGTLTDACAGGAFLAAGVVGWRSSRRHATIAYVAGLAWFAGNVAAPLLWVHRPLMLHAGLAFPGGRLADRASRVLLAAWWAAAVVPVLARSGYVSLVLAAGASVVGVRLALTAPLGRRSSSRTAATSVICLAAALALAAVDRLVPIGRGPVVSPPILYAGLVTVAGTVLLARRLQPQRETDVVVELTENDPAETLEALRREAATSDDERTRLTLAAAIELLQTNRDLHAELEESVEEVRASRRRLVEAAVDERQRLERRLTDGAVRYLDELDEVLAQLASHPDLRDLAEQGADEVGRTREDLAQLGRGLHPRVLVEAGLGEALAELAGRSPVPTSVRVPDRRLPELVEATVWYACAEAVANMVKHAAATEAGIDVRLVDAVVTARVVDNGVGGARATPDGGLAGLADRLSAVDGSLVVCSPPGGGTEVAFQVPVP